MRRLLKIIDNLARLIAVIDIEKQISEYLASKKATNNTKKETQPTDFSAIALSSCDPYRIQTCNLLIRSQTLYSIELRDHFSFLALQSYCHFLNWQAFLRIFFKKFSGAKYILTLSITVSTN